MSLKSHNWKSVLFLPAAQLCFGLVFMRVAQAHDPGLSSAELRLENGRLAALLTFARADVEILHRVDTNRDGRISAQEFDLARPWLQTFAMGTLAIQSDGKDVALRSAEAQFDEKNNIHFLLTFAKFSGTRLLVHSPCLLNLPAGHRQYLAFYDAAGHMLVERMLRAGKDTVEFSADPGAMDTPAKSGVGQFLLLGIEHILTGYDHLVFLLGLLIAGATLVSAARIITSFTVAHSITLALATLNVVQLPARIVEPLIAVSIVYVGLENIFSRDLKRRWLLTFAFGLAHGFGFASALRELGIGIGGRGAMIPLVSFNLGVEVGQIAVAALALPLIWRLRQTPSFAARFAPACSLLVALAGSYWFIQRLLLK